MSRRFCSLGILTLATLCASGLAAAGNPDKGRELFATCAACHTPGQGAVTPGPDLRGLIGRQAGTVPGFRYSRAMKNSKIVWSDATLDAYLENPQTYIPGNAMPFPGLPEPKERQELIAYLQTLK